MVGKLLRIGAQVCSRYGTPETISARQTAMFPHINCTGGDEAWETGEWSETEQGKPHHPIQSKGYWSTIYIREGDNSKIAMLIYNLTPAHSRDC
jgi:hypothetical protein